MRNELVKRHSAGCSGSFWFLVFGFWLGTCIGGFPCIACSLRLEACSFLLSFWLGTCIGGFPCIAYSLRLEACSFLLNLWFLVSGLRLGSCFLEFPFYFR